MLAHCVCLADQRNKSHPCYLSTKDQHVFVVASGTQPCFEHGYIIVTKQPNRFGLSFIPFYASTLYSSSIPQCHQRQHQVCPEPHSPRYPLNPRMPETPPIYLLRAAFLSKGLVLVGVAQAEALPPKRRQCNQIKSLLRARKRPSKTAMNSNQLEYPSGMLSAALPQSLQVCRSRLAIFGCRERPQVVRPI
jgi:hypothetical protein